MEQMVKSLEKFEKDLKWFSEKYDELKANPKEFNRKLREVVWKGKDVEKIYGELVAEKPK